MRRFQTLSDRASATAGVSLWVTPTSTSRPGESMLPTTVPATLTDAEVTRCTTALMAGRLVQGVPVGCGAAAGGSVLTLLGRPAGRSVTGDRCWRARSGRGDGDGRDGCRR